MSFMAGREFGSKTGSGFVSKEHEVCLCFSFNSCFNVVIPKLMINGYMDAGD